MAEGQIQRKWFWVQLKEEIEKTETVQVSQVQLYLCKYEFCFHQDRYHAVMHVWILLFEETSILILWSIQY